MTSLTVQHALSVEDYLAREEAADTRHEYIDGQLYAMTGASRAHALIAGNIHAALRSLVRGSSCQAFINDMKLRLQIAGQEIFYYPDLLVTCDSDDRATYFCSAPCLVIEVLSESTERIDRREKLLAYQTIPSLETYWLVAQDTWRVECYRRANHWRPEVRTSGTVPLDCLGGALTFDVIYEDVPKTA